MKCKNAFLKLLIVSFITIFITSSYLIMKNFLQFKESEKATRELIEEVIENEEKTEKQIVNWKQLTSINSDIIGWIKIDGTKINYPILQDNNNLFYIKHDYNKKYNPSGSIFTINENPFKDDETIIYGHNMLNGSMFSNLDRYLTDSFLYSHLSIKIYTKTKNYDGKIFSVYSTGVIDEINNSKNLSFSEKIEYYKEASKYTIDNIDENISKIVKLSTCSYINAKSINTDQRYYIIASITPDD